MHPPQRGIASPSGFTRQPAIPISSTPRSRPGSTAPQPGFGPSPGSYSQGNAPPLSTHAPPPGPLPRVPGFGVQDFMPGPPPIPTPTAGVPYPPPNSARPPSRSMGSAMSGGTGGRQSAASSTTDSLPPGFVPTGMTPAAHPSGPFGEAPDERRGISPTSVLGLERAAGFSPGHRRGGSLASGLTPRSTAAGLPETTMPPQATLRRSTSISTRGSYGNWDAAPI